MQLKTLKLKKALNQAFLKVKPNRTEIERFKTNLIQLLDRTNDTESEEFHKNLVIDFLKKTYYDPNHFINTKGKNDLVIHNANNASSTVGVIIEAKKPTNKAEMISTENINRKAFQELVLYYLRERITHKNVEVKNLIVTNINEWYIFDAILFDRLFAQNKNLVKQFIDFEEGRLAEIKTDFFYTQIAAPFIEEIKVEIEFTYFNLQDYQQPLRNENKEDDKKLIALFKLLSAEHLLKLPFVNDSNSLDKKFYSELLHIIGLTETKDGSKKLIERNKDGERNTGSILEDTIIQLDSLDKINRLEKVGQYGDTQQERLFNVGLELSITWINRILFLKLLEGQLISYHKGDKSYSFLNYDKIKNYDDLNSLFFQVLARKYEERNTDVKKAFEKVPYLNSSLFEPTEIEQVTLLISNLKDDKTIPVITNTVLKNNQGKKLTGQLTTLEYLFKFLDAYDFTSEGAEDIQEDNKALINASVLGLIFEKINGYKDGSFFTPGFITMYMCRETIRKAVVQKFNETKQWSCTTIEELYDKIENRKEANDIVNSIKICDPAVGSGHFLVSALNEMIAVKNDLKILQDRTGKRLKEYHVQVVNDELIVTDEEGDFFEYLAPSALVERGRGEAQRETQRIQETLFHEKQTIIENCLFGVDINTNSVKICRLRLWIELLKSAYYKVNPAINKTNSASSPSQSSTFLSPSGRIGGAALETLPNIDINIKCGNSLVSRFAIDADLSHALKKSKWTIDSYRIAVDTYRNAESKEQKREMEKLIANIKTDFRSEISLNDPKIKKLQKLNGEVLKLTTEQSLFEISKKEKTEWNKQLEKITIETKKLETEIEEIKANKIYENAFEWRFEFPEVLNDNGDFVGFDVVIGNPPYVVIIKSKHGKQVIDYFNFNYLTSEYNPNTYALFTELAFSKLLKSNGHFSYIIPNSWLGGTYFNQLRSFISQNKNLELINLKDQAFDVIVETVILISQKGNFPYIPTLKQYLGENIFHTIDNMFEFGINPFEKKLNSLIEKILEKEKSIKDYCFVYRGVETKNNSEWISESKKGPEWKEILLGKDVNKYSYKYSGSYIKFIPKELKSNANIDYYNKAKILMRRTGNFIIACADYSNNIALKNLYLIIPNQEDYIPLVLAQLNSKLFDFIHTTLTSGENKVFAQFPAHYVESLPCKINTDFIEQAKLLIDRRMNEKGNQIAIETQIDQLVYALYNLTAEEIAIVEGGVK